MGPFQIIFTLMFIVVVGFIIFTIVRNIAQWNKNNHSPRLTVEAEVVGKRIQVTTNHHDVCNVATNTTQSVCYDETSYYATFQVESGDRMEFRVNHTEYGMLAEGDRGRLTFQGTRYLSFERKIF